LSEPEYPEVPEIERRKPLTFLHIVYYTARGCKCRRKRMIVRAEGCPSGLERLLSCLLSFGVLSASNNDFFQMIEKILFLVLILISTANCGALYITMKSGYISMQELFRR